MFHVTKSCGAARTGELTLRAKTIQTPFFMPVATFASGRGVGPSDYKTIGVDAIICNAFLLSLRPGAPLVASLGGLGRFMHFTGAIMTDSGGFQSSRVKLFVRTSRKGVHLKSPFDGKTVIMTPKKLMTIQELLGSDVAMVIDDMAPPDATKEEFAKALQNTNRWAKECLDYHKDKKQLLFAIVQGGYDKKLREESAKYLVSLGFDGYAIGGCAIGEPKPDMYLAIQASVPHLPENKPRYLMGVGSPPDIVKSVGLGIDCFDSIFPTRNARHNMIFTRRGSYQLEKARHKDDQGPLEEDCSCWVCKEHTKAYIRHLSTVNESEGKRLRQVHNLHFMMCLMEDIRKSILKGKYDVFAQSFYKRWFAGKVPALYQEDSLG